MKKFKVLLLLLFISIFMTGCLGDEPEDNSLLKGKHDVVITVKDYGVIELELDADVAPITVTNFIDLVKDKFYDGLTFHRIMDGFMIQGGDPEGNGTGGSKNTIKGEFTHEFKEIPAVGKQPEKQITVIDWKTDKIPINREIYA